MNRIRRQTQRIDLCSSERSKGSDPGEEGIDLARDRSDQKMREEPGESFPLPQIRGIDPSSDPFSWFDPLSSVLKSTGRRYGQGIRSGINVQERREGSISWQGSEGLIQGKDPILRDLSVEKDRERSILPCSEGRDRKRGSPLARIRSMSRRGGEIRSHSVDRSSPGKGEGINPEILLSSVDSPGGVDLTDEIGSACKVRSS